MNKRSLPDRYADLRHEKGLSQTGLAAALNCNKQYISKFEDGTRSLSLNMLQKYAVFFGVSTDYLLGISDIRSPDSEIQAVCKYTGLSEKAVERLHFYAELHKTFSSDSMKYLSDMIVEINPAVLSVQFESIKNELERLVNMLVKYFEKNADDENYAENFAEFETEINNQIEFCDLMRYRAEVSFRDHLNLLDSRNTNYDKWKIVKEKFDKEAIMHQIKRMKEKDNIEEK